MEAPLNNLCSYNSALNISIGGTKQDESSWSLGIIGQDKVSTTKNAQILEKVEFGKSKVSMLRSYEVTEQIESTNILFFTLEGRKVYVNPIGYEPKLEYDNVRFGLGKSIDLFKAGPIGVGIGAALFTDW